MRPFDYIMLWLETARGRELAKRFIVLVVIAGSLLWVVSGLSALRSVRQQFKQCQRKQNELFAKMQEIQNALRPEAIRRVDLLVDRANRRLFQSLQELQDWAQQQGQNAHRLGMQCAIRGLDPQPYPGFEKFLLLLPIEISVTFSPSSLGIETNRFLRLLHFCEEITQGKRRIDWSRLELIGNTNTLVEAHIQLKAWCKKEFAL